MRKHQKRGGPFTCKWRGTYFKSMCGHRFSEHSCAFALKVEDMNCKRCLSLMVKDAERGFSHVKKY